ncbi:type II/IV secretion system protein [Candidatus Jorgensenbacteria bacterium]|nr:type II/IV secretion system protein [Candidatus Jorgensenbacteria bacterium]
MTDQDLLKELVKRQLIDEARASRLLNDAGVTQRPVEEILYEQRIVDEAAVAKVKSDLIGAPYKKIVVESIGEDILKMIPRHTSMNYRVIPIELDKSKNLLVVGMFRPDDVRAQEALKFIAKQQGVSVGVYVVTPSDMAAVWRRYAPYKSEVQAALQEIGEIASEERAISLEEGGSQSEAPIIKIVASTLSQAVEEGASDVHIEPQRTRIRIRFRTDGKLTEVISLPASLAQPLVSRVKVLARLKLDETRIPQDGRFRTVLFGRDIDFRVSTFPTPSGEKAAIRVLDPTTGLKNFNALGLMSWNAKILESAIARPYGMILISGPTGSGKTTTLYAIMQRLNQESVNVLSLEDPVEYFMEGINQSQVRPEIDYTFASGLRQILRQDPDVIMVGEIRDSETAGLAVNAALTGHIVLSTIHTNNAVGVIPRLVDLGVPTFLLSSALDLMIAQRLVLKLCPECKKGERAIGEVQEVIEKALSTLPSKIRADIQWKSPYTIYKAEPKENCKVCKGKGTAGRIAIFELFSMTRELEELISTSSGEGKLWDEARRQGMVTLRQDGVLKALDGSIAFEEVLRETT